MADILIVHLTESYKLERTRTALRDFVAHKLKRDESYKEAGLVAFVSSDSQSWRFSFVRMEYETKRDPKTGKIKPEERLTPARRFSYLVGAEEECHTAQTRFLPLLQDTSTPPTLARIEEAFSVESVTKEFFNQYAALFKNTHEALDAIVAKDKATRADFAAKHVSTVDFAKKLLGQIVFLYFIQKKGWLGVARGGKWGDGPKNFMRQLADKAVREDKCLFNDVLEPLFYDTLATDRGHDAWCKIFQCRIPFLNGGLFEPLAGYDWQRTNLGFSNALFTNEEPTGQGDTGSGILDVFDRYNFTVNESEPLEIEVAIDPEMLGKVFENLIEENRRKGLGAFYTPREIVHYMCQESLINYLDTTLNTHTEPIHEGRRTQASLFGDTKTEQTLLTTSRREERISRTDIETFIREGEQAAHYEAARKDGTVSYARRLPKPVETHARALDNALASITVCDPAIGSGAFPVGMMTEIVRARMALNPYMVEAASPPLGFLESGGDAASTSRSPYHFKRHAIQNSIYGVDIDPGAVEIAKLRLWLSLVVDEEDVRQVQTLPNLDYKVVVGNSLLGVEKDLFNIEAFNKLEKLKPRFFDASDRDKKAKLKGEIEALIHDLTNGKEIFDFEIYFSEVFHAKKGFDVTIANPPYVPIKDITMADRKIFEQYYDFATGRFNLFYLFVERIKLLSATDGTSAFIIPDRILLNTQCKAIRHWLLNSNTLLELVSFAEQVFETAVVDSILLLFQKSSRKTNVTQARRKVSEKEIVKTALLEIPFSYFELSPSSQFDLNYSAPKHGLISKVRNASILLETISDTRDGIIQGKVEDLLFITKPIDIASKKLLFGENINSYAIRFANYWVNYIPDALMQEEIKRRGPGVRPGLWMRDAAIFERPKILTRQTADRIIAAFDESHFYYANTLHGTTITHSEYDPRYVLGVLNSKITTWFYRSNTDEEGKVFAQIKIELLRKLPIPQSDKTAQNQIVKLVKEIEEAKASDPAADTSKQTSLINATVYRLYNLTPEEIEIVESSAK
ncbi:MAG: TaqI-like C-terminal specificity domain-containing protein [Terrimicrobiaceae bacterium]